MIMITIYSIGFTQKSAEQFFGLIKKRIENLSLCLHGVAVYYFNCARIFFEHTLSIRVEKRVIIQKQQKNGNNVGH